MLIGLQWGRLYQVLWINVRIYITGDSLRHFTVFFPFPATKSKNKRQGQFDAYYYIIKIRLFRNKEKLIQLTPCYFSVSTDLRNLNLRIAIIRPAQRSELPDLDAVRTGLPTWNWHASGTVTIILKIGAWAYNILSINSTELCLKIKVPPSH
jgi:hypothetical protein